MTYTFVFEPEYYRIIPACIIDARASIPAIKNQIGSVIKTYCDNQVAVVNDQSIVYRIETELGVIAGYFVVQVNTLDKTGTLVMKQFRPAFVQFNDELDTEISNFITNNGFQPDYLF